MLQTLLPTARELLNHARKVNKVAGVEITGLENVDKVHLVRVVRLAGDAWAAKQIAKTIMDKLRL